MLSIFRRRLGVFLLVLLISVIGAAGWVLHEGNVRASLWDQTQRKAEELAARYVGTVRGVEGGLRTAIGADDSVQMAALEHLLAITEEVASQTEASFLMRLRGVTRIQVAADPLLGAAGEKLSVDGPFRHLQSQFGDRGELARLIQEYNTLARAWNVRASSLAGAFTASVTGDTPQLLPYLRPDGIQDDVLLIEI